MTTRVELHAHKPETSKFKNKTGTATNEHTNLYIESSSIQVLQSFCSHKVAGSIRESNWNTYTNSTSDISCGWPELRTSPATEPLGYATVGITLECTFLWVEYINRIATVKIWRRLCHLTDQTMVDYLIVQVSQTSQYNTSCIHVAVLNKKCGFVENHSSCQCWSRLLRSNQMTPNLCLPRMAI